MKKLVIAGTLAGVMAVGGTALALQAEKPAPKPRAARPAGENSQAGHTAPIAQPNTTGAPNAQAVALPLGNVRLPKGVKADGKEIPAGTYQVRLTPTEAKPDAKGSSEVLERWVEFTQKGEVKGREVVSIVPNDEIKLVQKDAPPPTNGAKVETLKGGDYLRVWINKAGNHYLIHLVH